MMTPEPSRVLCEPAVEGMRDRCSVIGIFAPELPPAAVQPQEKPISSDVWKRRCVRNAPRPQAASDRVVDNRYPRESGRSWKERKRPLSRRAPTVLKNPGLISSLRKRRRSVMARASPSTVTVCSGLPPIKKIADNFGVLPAGERGSPEGRSRPTTSFKPEDRRRPTGLANS